MMEKLAGKMIFIVLLAFGLFLASMLLLSITQERKRYQEKAVTSVAASVSGVQKVLGPVLVIPYKVSINTYDSETNTYRNVIKDVFNYILPQELSVTGHADVTPRHLGIYQVQLYTGTLKFQGVFEKIDLEEMRQKSGFISFGEPFFVISVSDSRGIINVSPFMLNQQSFEFKEGIAGSALGRGIHVPVALDALAQENLNPYAFELGLQGTQSFSMVPLGRKSSFMLESNWPHPSFLGSTLPQSREISPAGFSAHWQSSWFATNINDLFGDGKNPDVYSNHLPEFSVSMVETVDEYQLNERAVKYAILFISLTFISFLAFELLIQLHIHPIQYAFAGFSLVMFYLLLLAFSEHIGFSLAYGLAACASSSLIGIYLCSVLQSVKRGLCFSSGLLGLYGLLFLILHSEGMALLLGTLLLFIILASMMLFTRKIDWYTLSVSKHAE